MRSLAYSGSCLLYTSKEDLLHQQVVVSEIPESERNRLVRRYLDMMREFHLDRPGKDVILRSECTTFLIYAWRYQIDGESRISRNPIKTKAWIHIEKAIDYIQSCEPGVDLSLIHISSREEDGTVVSSAVLPERRRISFAKSRRLHMPLQVAW